MAGGSVKEERKREGRKGTDKIRTGKRKMEIKGAVKKKIFLQRKRYRKERNRKGQEDIR